MSASPAKTKIQPPGRLLTVRDVGELLNVKPSWIYYHARLRGRARLPSIKLGKYRRFQAAAIAAWLLSLEDD